MEPKNLEKLMQEVMAKELDLSAERKNYATKEFENLKYTDIASRIKNRNRIGWTVIILLLLQNLLVFGLVGWAFYLGQLGQLQIILGTLLTGTLGETVMVVNIIVKWLFSDIKYESTKAEKK